jgi:hypothetical protein
MRLKLSMLAIVFGLVLVWQTHLAAQSAAAGTAVALPFIDRDGDGINDMLQNGWGLRFMERYKKRQLIWEQLKAQIVQGLDGAGTNTEGGAQGDKQVREFMQQKMNELVDSNGDGAADISLGDFMAQQFKSFDRNGDGIPDDISKDEILKSMNEMREWRHEIDDRLRQGMPPLVDENGDGIPDDLPEGLGWRGNVPPPPPPPQPPQ